MNLSQQHSTTPGRENDCKNYFGNNVPWRFSSPDSFYGLLVVGAVINLAACPFTILLNALILIAVKTKRRLQTHPNILLACLSLTDLMTGLLAQPLCITVVIFLLQGKQSCYTQLTFTVLLGIFMFATVFHLFLISGERYLAIKHTFRHATVVTKSRLIICSVVAWSAAIVIFPVAFAYFAVVLFIGKIIILSSIILLHIFVYSEVRRHEKRIISEQASVEARAKFKQEKKALKLTTIILVTIFLCMFLPSIFVLIARQIFSKTFPPDEEDVKTLVQLAGAVPTIINSILNPVIYTLWKRQFRIAFIELLLRKSLQEAEQFDEKLFRSRIDAARPQNRPESAGQEQIIHENNPEVRVSGVDFCDKITTTTQDKTGLNNTSKKKMEQHSNRKLPTHDVSKQENDPEGLVASPVRFVDWKKTEPAHNENFNEKNEIKLTEKDSQHQVGSEKKEPRKYFAWNGEEDVGREGEIATQPEFDETSL